MNIPLAITGNLLVYTPPLSSGADSKARVSFVASQVFVGSRGRSSQQTSPTHWESPSAGIVNSRQAISDDLDVWVSTQDHRDEAIKVKSKILYALSMSQGLDLLHPFDLTITTGLSSIPPCLAKLNLKKLDCFGCRHLTTLPALSSCTHLDCSECNLLTSLPDLPNCAHLNCSGCRLLTALPALPSCADLNCSECNLLTALPALPSCAHLNCSRCRLLAAIPDLPSCRTLYCYDCNLLARLPALPNSLSLDCSRCRLLAALPALPSCHTLYCYDCNLLAGLPALPSCISLDCSNCPLLTALPALPNCTSLNCSNCRILTALPALHPYASVFGQGCPLLNLEARVVPPGDLKTCRIHWKDLNEDPLKVLRDLLPFLREGPFPNIVFLKEDGTPQEGSDAGGLGRHLMSQLFAQLPKLGCIPENPGTNRLRPTATANPTAAEKEILEALGLLFVSAADRKLPIGQIFDLAFFTDLQAFSGQNLGEYKKDPQAWIKKQCSERSPHIATSIKSCQTLELLNQTFSEYTIPEELELEEAKLFTLNTYIESTVQERSPWYEAAYLIALAMQGQQGWHSLRFLSAYALQTRIEGSFSKEAFKGAIHWQGTADVSTQGYLLKWIDTQNEEKVKELLQFSTGSLSLTGQSVIVMLSPPAVGGGFPLPISHTCARQLCLPTGYSSQEMFDDKMKQSLEDAEANGFLFA